MIPKDELKIERIRGTGPGGQHKNKVATCVRVTHIPTKIVVVIDGRYQHKNLALALKELERRIEEEKSKAKAKVKKAKRDEAIHNTKTIRTYDFKTGIVTDHRSGKKASIKDVLIKGKINLLQ